jgi:hypothetical protein
MYTVFGTYCSFYMTVCCPRDNRQCYKKDKYHLLYPYGEPPDDGL